MYVCTGMALLAFCRRGRDLPLDGGTGFTVLSDEVRGEEEGEGGKDGGAAGRAAVLVKALLAGRVGKREGAKAEHQQGRRADGKRGELRKLLAENRAAGGPGEIDDDPGEPRREHQERGVGKALARTRSAGQLLPQARRQA